MLAAASAPLGSLTVLPWPTTVHVKVKRATSPSGRHGYRVRGTVLRAGRVGVAGARVEVWTVHAGGTITGTVTAKTGGSPIAGVAVDARTVGGDPRGQKSWQRQGFDAGDFADGGSRRLKEAMVVSGVDAIRARVEEHHQAGADHVCLQVLGADLMSSPGPEWGELAEALLA